MKNKILLTALLVFVSSFAFAQTTYIINNNPVRGKVVHPQECQYSSRNVSARWVWPWPCGMGKSVLEVETSHKEGMPNGKVCEVSTGDTIVLPVGCYRMSTVKRKHLYTENGYVHERYTALMNRKLHWFVLVGTYGQERKVLTNRFYSIGEDCKYVIPVMNSGYYVIYNDNYAYIFNKKPVI